MLPDVLFGSYRRYKADTDRFTTWLTETAQACGYNAPQTHAPSSRMKGKARKQAKKAAAPSASTATTTRYRVELKDFPLLAQHIAAFKEPRIQVPLAIVQAAQKAIAARKRCTRWFSNHASGTSGSRQINEQHLYFVSALETVLEILRPCFAPGVKDHLSKETLQTEPLSRSPGHESNEEPMTNMFEMLDLEEPSDPPVQPRKSTSKAPKKNIPSSKNYEVACSRSEDLLFAIYCLFDDINNILEHVRMVWRQYKAKELDLMTAAVVSSTACDLVRRAEEEFITLYPQHAFFEDHAIILYNFLCEVRGEDPSRTELPGDYLNFAMLDAADWLLYPTYLLVNSLINVLRASGIPTYKDGHFGAYEASVDRSTLSPRERLQEDKIILCSALTDFALFQSLGKGVPVEDELIRGLRDAEMHKVPLWLTFAAQVFLDVHYILRTETSRGFQEFRSVAQTLHSNLTQYLADSSDKSINQWTPGAQKSVSELRDSIYRWVNYDVIGELRYSARHVIVGEAAAREYKPYSFFRGHPVLCGLMCFNFILRYHQLGVAMANAWQCVMFVAHLYNAARKNNCLADPWPDMERVIRLQTPERLFVGGAPTTPEECLKRGCLVLGFSPQMFASHRTQRARITSTKGARTLNETSPVSDVLRNRFCHYGPMNLTVATVESLLATANATTKGETLKRQWAVHHKLSPIQLLSALQTALVEEHAGLTLNYFSLHERCFKLLDTIRSELHDRFIKYVGNPYMADQTTQLPFLVLHIFTIAMKSGKAAETMHVARDFRREHGLRSGEVTAVSMTLIKSGEVLARVVEEHGSTESKEIETLQDVLKGASADFEPLDRIQEIEDELEVQPVAERVRPVAERVQPVAERAPPPQDNHETALGNALGALYVEVARRAQRPPGPLQQEEVREILDDILRGSNHPWDLDSGLDSDLDPDFDSEMSDWERETIDDIPQEWIDQMTPLVEPLFSKAVRERYFPEEFLGMLEPIPQGSAPQADTATPDDSQCVPAPPGMRFTDGTTAVRSAAQLALLNIRMAGF